MKVQAGDLAVWRHRGYSFLVSVVRRPDATIYTSVCGICTTRYDLLASPNSWIVESLGSPLAPNGGLGFRFQHLCALEVELTPLRDQDGEDEMLRITGIPAAAPKAFTSPKPQREFT